MKTIITVILLGAISLGLHAQNFTLKGHFTDIADDTLLIEYVRREPDKRVVSERIPVDSNGFFKYSCDIKWAYNAELTVKSNGYKSHLFLVPDESAEIEGPCAYWKINGTAFYQRMDSINQMLQPFYKEFDATKSEYDKGMADGLDKAVLDSIKKAANMDINKRMWKVTHQYITEHPNDEISAAILLSQDYTDILPAIRMLSPEVRNGRFRNYIDIIDNMFSRLDKEIKAKKSEKLKLQEGKLVPDFTLKDIDGEDFSLHSILGKGKYIVVDFWGSWCSWCIKGFPKMKEYYDRFRDKLEIVGVACYDKEDKWKASVRKNNAPWIHVFSPDGKTEVRFGVTAYPYKVVVSPDGKVIKCFTGETDEFYNMLDDVLK